nr:cation:proton antiporter [Dehalococcoidales bacterium]
MEGQTSFISLFIISLLAFAVPIVAMRVKAARIPIVALEIVAGMLVGKSGLDLVSMDSVLAFLSSFGFAYLMFLSGLEIDFDLIFARRLRPDHSLLRQPLGLSALSFILTVALALGVSTVFHRMGLVNNPWLVALVLSTTSVGIVMPTLKERRLTASEWGQTILVSALVADFVTMLLIVLFATVMNEHGQTLQFLLVFILFAAFFSLYRLGLTFLRRRPVVGMMNELSHTTAQIRVRGCFALILAFVALSLQLGVEAILGAFLAGAMVSLLAGRQGHELRLKLDAIGYGFFIPIFFITVGIEFDLPTLLGSPSTLVVVPALVGAAYLLKVVPSLVFRLRYGWRQTLAGGVLLSSRLSLIIAASAIALRLGAITEATNAGMILVAIITSTVSPALFGRLLSPMAQRKRPVVVLGDGGMAASLAWRLAAQAEKVVLIGQAPADLQEHGVSCVDLNGNLPATLEGAGVRQAKALVAASADEEFNFGACLLAKDRYGLERCIA